MLKLMDEALDHPDVAVCICSAATKEGFIKVLEQAQDLKQDCLKRLRLFAVYCLH